jgi:uncharacterized membrane protein YvlD (DUF360 family)
MKENVLSFVSSFSAAIIRPLNSLLVFPATILFKTGHFYLIRINTSTCTGNLLQAEKI